DRTSDDGATTSARHIPARTGAALLMAAGLGLLLLPVAFGLSIAAIVTGGAIGIVTTGLGLAGTATDGRGTIPLSTHALYDRGLSVGLIAIAIGFGVIGQGSALAFFTAAGLSTLILALFTRYSARPGE